MDQDSPLAPTLSRYADFFALFGDFRGYVSFFLLDDLVTDDGSVKFFMPFDDFRPDRRSPRTLTPTRSTAAGFAHPGPRTRIALSTGAPRHAGVYGLDASR